MSRLSFATAKTLLAEFVTSQGPTDPIVAKAINFVTQDFVTSGRWKGNRFTSYFAVYDGQFRTPAHVESVEKIIMIDENQPNQEISERVSIQSDWYQFHENGPGLFPENYVGKTRCLRQGDGFCTFREPLSPAVPLIISKDASGALSGTMVIKAKDQNGDEIWINGVEGIQVNLASLPVTTSQSVSSIYAVEMPAHVGRIFIDSSPSTHIAIYGPNEICPNYQAYRLVGNYPETRTVYALCQRAYVPLSLDTDEVVPANIGALRYGVQAYNYDNLNDSARASHYWNKAYKALNQELEIFQGDATIRQVQVQVSGFARPIANLF